MHYYKPSSLLLVLAALIAGVFLAGRDTGQVLAAGSFSPTTVVTLADHTPNAASDGNVTLNIPGGDYNFASVVNASPAAAFTAPGPGNPAFVGGTHPAIGDSIGTLSSSTFLGLTNNACNTNLTVTFTFLNATADNSSGNSINPLTPGVAGTAGTLENLMSDDGSAASANSGAGSPATITGAEATNGLPASVDRYPSYLNAIFDPDFINYGLDGLPFTGDDVNGPTPPVQPLARYVGNQVVAGTAVVLNLVYFSNSQLANAFPPPHPFADLGNVGATSVAVLQDPTAAAAPSSITDFCSPLAVTTVVYGQSHVNPCKVTPATCPNPIAIGNPTPGAPTGLDRYRNPAAAGSYLWINFNQSLRDKDQDSYENQLDTCASTVNVDNPHIGPPNGGTDNDGLDQACDPTPGANTGAGNHDGDVGANGGAYLNAQDNCPILANNDQKDDELNQTDYVARSHGGPKVDGIGDVCDADTTHADGQFFTVLNVAPNCIGGIDVDNDGWCSAAGAGMPADPNDASAGQTPEDYDIFQPMYVAHAGSGPQAGSNITLLRQPVQVCNDGLDNDGDTLVDRLDQGAGANTCRPKGLPAYPQGLCGGNNTPALNGGLGCQGDADGDGYTDEAEILIGTDPLGRCQVGTTAPSNAWPSDFTSGGVPLSTDKITITDITSFVAPAPKKNNTNPGDAGFNVRWDLVPGPGVFATWINTNDITALIAGASGLPPMFGGTTKANNGPACTNHPNFGN